MNDKTDDQDRDYDERLVSAIYRETSNEQPPAALDEAILSMAKSTQQSEPISKPRKKKAWLFPSSVAASVMVVTFVYLAIDDQRYRTVEPEALSAPAAIEPTSAQVSQMNSAEKEAKFASSSGAQKAMRRDSVNESATIMNDSVMPENENMQSSFSASAPSESRLASQTAEDIYQSLLTIQQQLSKSHQQIMAEILLQKSRTDELKETTQQKTKDSKDTLAQNGIGHTEINTQPFEHYQELQLRLYTALLEQQQKQEDFVLLDKYRNLLSESQIRSF
ncbi:MAG: hypothetical protein AAGJ37_11895 [Pseudomonadota bacterium]